MTVKLKQSDIIRKNAEYIAKRVKNGVSMGASKQEMYRVLAKELGVTTGSINLHWYGRQRKAKNGEHFAIRDLEGDVSNPLAVNKPAEKNNDLLMESLNSIKKEILLTHSENHVHLIQEVKKIQLSQEVINKYVTNKFQSKQKLMGTGAKYLVDRNQNVKLIESPSEWNSDDDKIESLMSQLDQQDKDIELKSKLLEDRRLESNRLAINLKNTKEELEDLTTRYKKTVRESDKKDSMVIEAKRELAVSNNKNIDLKKSYDLSEVRNSKLERELADTMNELNIMESGERDKLNKLTESHIVKLLVEIDNLEVKSDEAEKRKAEVETLYEELTSAYEGIRKENIEQKEELSKKEEMLKRYQFENETLAVDNSMMLARMNRIKQAISV